VLKAENDLIEITDEVDPCLALAEIHRQAVAGKNKALLFTNVKGTRFPVATNLYGSQKRIELAFRKSPIDIIKQLVSLVEQDFPPRFKTLWNRRKLLSSLAHTGTKHTRVAPVLAHKIDRANLKELPQIKAWPEDGGPFITLPLVYTQSPTSQKENLGMYRIQIHDQHKCGVHMQIHRGGGFHFYEAEQRNQPLPAHIYIGGPPALTLSAIAPLPENISELLFASLLLGQKIRTTIVPSLSPLPLLADTDFCIVGQIPPHKKLPEGPFGDHYGYYSSQHEYPFLNISQIFHRNGAIFPATVVGRPPQEDHFITNYLQEMFAPLIRLTMPQVKALWAYEEAGVHTLAGAVVCDRYPREALTTALRILGEGQLSLTKNLFVTDQPCDLKNIKEILVCVLERIDFATDLFVLSHTSQDTLDETGPKPNHGSKSIFLGVGEKKRALPNTFSGPLPSPFSHALVFCPGVLCLTAPTFVTDQNCVTRIGEHACFDAWPLVFIFDDAALACASPESFLWHAFTRFEPAADIGAKRIRVERLHISFTPPMTVDCRCKPWYPKTLESDPQVVRGVQGLIDQYLI